MAHLVPYGDLREVNLSGAQLGDIDLNHADLSGAKLAGAILIGAILVEVDLSEAILTAANLTDANLSGAELTGADLTGANLTGANLIGANLIDVNLTDANLSRVDLVGAVLIGANLSRANLSGTDLTGADLTGVNLRGADLTDAILTDANLTNADLTDADLNDATLSGAFLSGVNLTHTNIIGADFTDTIGNIDQSRVRYRSRELGHPHILNRYIIEPGADLSDLDLSNLDFTMTGTGVDEFDIYEYGPNLAGANLTNSNLNQSNLWRGGLNNALLSGASLIGTNLNNTDLTYADLTGAKLHSASLIEADLANADLSNADLIGADLKDANLMNANLTDANLSGANLSGTNLDGADLTGVIIEHDMFPQWLQQHQQRQQHQQDEQEYEIQRAQTNLGGTTAWYNSCRLIMPEGIPPYLKYSIEETEIICREQLSKRQDHVLLDYFRSKERITVRGTHQIVYQWTRPDGSVNDPVYFFDLLTTVALTSQSLKFISTTGQIAEDYGGITRTVFSKAGEYINNIMITRANRLYFPPEPPKDFGAKLSHIVKLAMMQGVVLGIPLSYGLLYCMQKGPLRLKEMSLPILLYLYNQDDPDGFLLSLRYIGDDALEQLAEVSGELPGYLSKKAHILPEDRLEWLRRYLYTLLYGTGKGVRAFLQPYPQPWDVELQVRLKVCALSEIAEILGTRITYESMHKVLDRAIFEGGSLEDQETLRAFMERYLAEIDVDQMAKWMIFATGSTDQMVTMKFVINQNRGRLPVAHTCSNEMNFAVYYDYGYDYEHEYEKFKSDMNYSISAHEDFGVV